jgi:hypothetical protein
MLLEAVFWDYPQYNNEEVVRRTLAEKRGTPVHDWMLARFLEHGRAVDSMALFPMQEIASALPRMPISDRARRKWSRLVEVYGAARRG